MTDRTIDDALRAPSPARWRVEAEGLESVVATLTARANRVEREAGNDSNNESYRRGVATGYRLAVGIVAEMALARRIRARDVEAEQPADDKGRRAA